MGKVLVMEPETRQYARSYQLIAIKQRGMCWFCRQIVKFGDIFVSHGSKKTKYYHEGCARKVMLIV